MINASSEIIDSMKVVGRRKTAGDSIADQGRLARTATALRGRGFAPTGVYRFRTFDEADAWMTAMMLRTRRPQDAIDRAFLEGLLNAGDS